MKSCRTLPHSRVSDQVIQDLGSLTAIDLSNIMSRRLTFPLFFIGNPLLDIQVTNGEKLLEKYNLKENDAILASPEQMSIYEDVVNDYKPVYLSGGAAQNAARAAAYVLPPASVAYTGCVGDDDLSEKLRKANRKEDVESAYQVKAEEKTGACAVILTGVHRSLVTRLGAAEKFDSSHLSSDDIAPLIEAATHFYIGGFFLTHGIESALIICKHALEAEKTVALNLAAPFICQVAKAELEQVFEYADFIIGNESEAVAWAEASGLPSKDLGEIATALANFKKINAETPRTVVITNGAEPTTAVTAGSPAKTYPVQAIPPEKIVDTNGAGDAFAGGFIAAILLGKSIDQAVEVGHKLGAICVTGAGPKLRYPKVRVL
ncbi:Ribokinase-like protein [Cantharellus anzutake]|uniref:Ribokinase-like protein n=1 Tax=Cantharellus anzutake TaxID=1750568 RepID=UPI001907C972|nr:Ribokinase-like protein [Cantharellus anzutake]KAF8326394.1 Ribokinase-like protein [Cantharellus anzutake]